VLHHLGFGKELVGGVAGECAEGDAAEVELSVAAPQELAGGVRSEL
jgi:hypothetical protein